MISKHKTRTPSKTKGHPPTAWIGCLAILLASLILATPIHATSYPDNGIPIASIYALTGPTAAVNRSSVRGVRLAVREINAGGGLLGRRLELMEFDNRGTPIGSKVAADEAVARRVTAIIGPAFSSHALAVAKVAQADRVPMITSVATHPNVTVVGDYVFRACFNDRFQGNVLGRFARQQLRARWVVMAVNLDSDYSIGLADGFEKTFTQLGGKILASLSYNPRQTHFRELVTQVLSEAPDILFIPGNHESARIVEQAMARGMQATPLGGDGWDSNAFFKMGGQKIKRGYFTTHWHESLGSDRSKKFVASYGDLELTATSAALAYDAVYLFADAARRAGSVERADIRDALAATRDFVGVTGRLDFDTNGDPDKSVVVMEIRNGRPQFLQQVSPDQASP